MSIRYWSRRYLSLGYVNHLVVVPSFEVYLPATKSPRIGRGCVSDQAHGLPSYCTFVVDKSYQEELRRPPFLQEGFRGPSL